MIRNISNWQAYLKYKYGGRKAKDFLFKCRNGFEIRVPERLLHTFKECFFGEDYLKGFSAGFRKSDVNVVIDVGANVGYFSLFILSKFPDAQVYAYEPLPKNFNLLKTYKESLSLSNLNIQNSAVNHSAKDIVLHYDASDSYSTGASIFENETGEDSINVQATSIPAILENNELQKVDLLKLDCEGSEYEIIYNLPDSSMEKIIALVMETHEGTKENQNHHAMCVYLRRKGFKVKSDNKSMIWSWK